MCSGRKKNIKSPIGDDTLLELDEFSAGKWFCHAVRPLPFAVRPDDFECFVAAFTVVAKEVVCNADVSGEL